MFFGVKAFLGERFYGQLFVAIFANIGKQSLIDMQPRLGGFGHFAEDQRQQHIEGGALHQRSGGVLVFLLFERHFDERFYVFAVVRRKMDQPSCSVHGFKKVLTGCKLKHRERILVAEKTGI